MIKNARIISVSILLFGLLLTAFIDLSEKEGSALSRFPFRLGLDLSGGTQLIYSADTSDVTPSEVPASMNALREVIERRVNLFGVSEPRVQTERGGVAGEENRLIVELPGVTDIEEAVAQIGETPILEFRLQTPQGELGIDPEAVTEDGQVELGIDDLFTPTGLTGSYVERAQVQFDQVTGEAIVVIDFNREGRELFSDITTENVGEVLAIFLDGEPISLPVIETAITDGTAVISGGFEPEEARELARDLNYGALPIPVELVATNSVGPTLGVAVFEAGVRAGIIGLILVALFMVIWYRLPGLVAVVALTIYTLVNLALYKLIPVTLTAAGIAGFILSIGMAVDANILIFSRMGEELRRGKKLEEAIQTGFKRAWVSVMDGNLTVFLSGVVLFWFGTSLIQGFALTLMIGTVVSVATAGVVSRTLLLSLVSEKEERNKLAFFRSGFRKAKNS